MLLPPRLRALTPFLLAYSIPFAGFADVIINEIHSRPDVKTEPVEFVELLNTGATAVDLSGWRLADAVDYTFPNGTSIGAGAYLVAGRDPGRLAAKFGITALGPWLGTLDNDGERIQLLNAAGGVEDEVEYGLGFPWPTVGEPPGYSLELIHPSLDNDLGGSWRSSLNTNVVQESTLVFPAGSGWVCLRGIDEASDPTTAWRLPVFDTTGWTSGPGPVGYDASQSMGTRLDDMNGAYTSFFLRKTFVIDDPSVVTTLRLEALYDDGFKAWINGTNVLNQALPTGEVSHEATATGSARESNNYDTLNLDSPAAYLRRGTNVLAVQVHNILLSGSSDCFFDARLTALTGPPSHGPTPGRLNSVFSTNAPPQIRQVAHNPEQPASGTAVRITAKITDPDGMGAVTLSYQAVHPGSYVELTDAAYASGWVAVAMNDAGTGGDALAGDSVYTATIPPAVQQHRRLVRYRIQAADAAGRTLGAPYADDPAPNFAYFCYDGVPAWQGALRPGISTVESFETNVTRRLPVIHLISKRSEVEDATWFSRYGGDAYPWTGTIVYDGEVYDHIHFRARGGVWRYAMVKNMWKFDFNNGHDFQMRDDYGRAYETRWTKLNLGASIQQGDYQHRGEQGMFESVGFRLFNLAGVESPNTVFAQLRVIDDVLEADPSTQYEGDFWGVYLVIEQEDGRFLDEHNLPDGNFYKMEGGTGSLNNLSPTGPEDRSDLDAFLGAYRNTASPPTEDWWRANLRLENYYSYQAIVQGIHHYDICYDKNYFYYANPVTGLWSVHSWDLDLTWADNMFDSGCGGRDDLFYPVLGGGGYPAYAAMTIQYKNRVREIRDLLFNTNQAWQVIDEHARILRDPAVGPTILDADRYMWDYNPKMTNTLYSSTVSKAGWGRFYQWPETGVTKDFDGVVQLMKNYVVYRGSILTALANDTQIPAQPAVTYDGPPNYPLNQVAFRTTAYSGLFPFAAMKWRVGEVTDPAAPAYDPAGPVQYEIAAVWETPEITTFSDRIIVPAGALKVGHAYRARVRMKDMTGRWSAWSAPVQFVAGLPENAAALVEHLRVTEFMADPPAGSMAEFIELQNTSPTLSLALDGAAFNSGVTFSFPADTVVPPLGYLLVIRDPDPQAFRARYGLGSEVPITGPYAGSLANEGEQLNLKTGPGGLDIVSFEYGNGRGWPVAASGAGHSLVPITTEGQATGALDYPGNWRASAFPGGSPGGSDPAPEPVSVLLNEVAAHTDYANPQRPEYDSNDWIELYNATGSGVNLAGWFLSDDPADLRKFALPATVLPARGRLVLDEVAGFHDPITSGFGIDKSGEQILLSYLPGNADDRVVDAVRFKGQPRDRSLSRYPDGSTWWFQTAPTRDAANTAGESCLRIGEIMYHPPDAGTNDNVLDEFVEVFNPTANAITLQDTNGPWRLDGGVDFVFPAGTTVGAGGFLLVVSFDPADTATLGAFRSLYGITNSALPVFGPYAGKLSNRSDRLALERPQFPDAAGDPYSWIIVDEVIYGNQTPWPATANGSGTALHRVSFSESGNAPSNWTAGPPSPGMGGEVVLDRDNDGMPDAWETQFDLDPDDAADAGEDADGDSMANLAEFLSGTNPTDAASALRLDVTGEPDGTVTLRFTAVANRSYSVLFRGGVDAGMWQKLTDVDAGPATREEVVVDSGSHAFDTRYYRLTTPSLP